MNCEILRQITLSHDMNKEERQKDKELREEAKNKNESQREIELGNFNAVRGDLWSRHLVRLRRDKEENAMRLRANAIYKNSTKGGTQTKAEDTHTMRVIMEKEMRITPKDEKRNSSTSQGEAEPPSESRQLGLTKVNAKPCVQVNNVNRFSVMFSHFDVLAQNKLNIQARH